MTDTLSTEQIRQGFYEGAFNKDWEAARAAQFDRWLEEHDRAIRNECKGLHHD